MVCICPFACAQLFPGLLELRQLLPALFYQMKFVCEEEGEDFGAAVALVPMLRLVGAVQAAAVSAEWSWVLPSSRSPAW